VSTPSPAPARGGFGANIVLGLLAGLMLLLSLPVLFESSDGAVGRLALLGALVILPAMLLVLVQRRAGGPRVPEVGGRQR
jgi:hypothetical protein